MQALKLANPKRRKIQDVKHCYEGSFCTVFVGASWKYLYSRGKLCLNWWWNDEGALNEKKQVPAYKIVGNKATKL